MSRTTKRFLSMLLAVAMLLSLGITGWAIDDGDITIVDPETEAARQTDEHVTAGFDGGTELELKEIDPDTLPIERLGEIEEDDILVAEELPFGLNDIVRVSIVLDKPSTMAAGYETQNIVDNRSAMAYRETLRRQQASVEAAIASAGVSMDVKWNLTLAVNIISAEVRYGDIETIQGVPGVKEVFLENRYEPQFDEINTSITTEYMVGASQVWANGYTGAGTRVAIVDTGTNQDHLSFSAEALEYALEKDELTPDLLTWADIEAVKTELNANTHRGNTGLTEEAYKNTKIPYAFNYIDGGYITDHDSDSQGEHGSHVSGIAAANRFVKIDGEFVDAAEKVFAVGVAPDAQILTMKVFGKGGGAYDSDYMAAIEDAIVLKADSVNLSLGSGQPGYTFSDGYQDVMDSLIECGTVVSISAGNSYNWANFLPSGIPYLYLEDVSLHTGGSPGTYVNSLCVAAAQNIGKATTPLFFNGDQKVIFTETSGYGNAPMPSIAGEYEYILIDGPGVDDNGNVGKTGDAFYALGSEVVEGKLALCYRGTSSFFAKANAAVGQGAIGTVIINNTAGTINMNLTGYEYSAPCVSILKADGDALKAASTKVTDDNGNVYYTGTVKITAEATIEITDDRSDATITEFSSWGVPGSLIMKPEITAPGGDIYSVNGMTDDEYEFMSGTSMAAPHITGMAALVSQYVKETELDKATGQNSRTLVNSLLMSTATPMIVDGAYLSVLQQGSGLGDISLATQALSYIMMDEDANSGAKDGKVKVELGDDPAREGAYSFGFTVNNFSDTDLVYELGTDMFVQWIAGSDGQGNLFLDKLTESLVEGEDFTVSYDFPQVVLSGHDVNKDGATNEADAQAILDYLTGENDGSALDLEAAEMDGVEGISSYDAQLLLKWEEQSGLDNLMVPAGESVHVSVSINYTEDLKAFLDYYFANGSWIEGFTYVSPISETEDGALLDVEHSIPILGFYGSFTDASMFDCVDPISKAYGSTKVSYTGNSSTNYLTINNGKGNKIFMGNPYALEDEFPAERLAISPSTKLVNIKYNQIRNAGTTGWMALDGEGNILKSAIAGAANGAWYYVNGQAWQETGTRTANLNTVVSSLGVSEGDILSVGFYAIPEYYGMKLHPGKNVNSVTADEIAQLLADGELGDGARIGFDFLVDATAPEAEAKISDDSSKISVTAKDNNYIAFIGIMDVSGNTIYAGEVPEQTQPGEEVEVTFDVSGLELPNGIAIFVGDYAGNEKAYLIVFDPDQPVVSTKTVYMLTDTVEDGKDYIVATGKAAGAAYALNSQGVMSYTGSLKTEIVIEGNDIYIPADTVQDSIVWTASGDASGFAFTNKGTGGWLGYYQANGPYVVWTNESDGDSFVYQNERLLFAPYASYGYGMGFSSPNFIFTASPTPLYLYTPVELVTELDPSSASSVTVTPESATLIIGVSETIELLATVEPIVVTDRTVTWSSSDETVATVSESGLVKAVSPGVATITATSNQTPDVSGSAVITVVESQPMDAVVYGQVAFGNSDIEYAEINLNDMSVKNLSGDAMYSAFYGGGRSGDFIYGNDSDNDFHRFDAENGYVEDTEYGFALNPTWALIDIGCFPGFTIADYSGVSETNPDPEEIDYNYILTGFNSSNNLCYFDAEGSLSRFNLDSIDSFVAVTFLGAETEPEEEENILELYYLLLSESGKLYIWVVYPNLENGGMSANYDVFANIGMLDFGEDKTAFSMSYYETEEDFGVFIADSVNGSVYYVDLLARDDDSNVDATYIGKITGATSLTSLSDFNYDKTQPLGTIETGKDGGNSIQLPEVNAAFRGINRGGAVLQSEKIVLEDLGGDDDIIIGEDDGEIEIDVVGGLDAIRTPIACRTFELTAAELINPDYDEDGVVEIALTTPDLEDVDTFYNGFVTVEYDPSVLTFKEFKPNAALEYTSFKVDEENGLIKFAYASITGVEAGSVAEVTFIAPEEATEITVTTKEANDNLDVNDVTVIELTAPFELSDTEITVPAQSNYQLSVTGPKNVTWSSSDEKVATVDENGKIFANLYGTAIITVTDGTRTRTCTVHVLFSDVVNPSYYFNPVYWAAEQGITKGYETGKDIGKFGVGFNCQRRELLIFLWRYAGEPTVDKDGNPYGNAQDMFNDLGSYGPTTATNKAIAWACTEGITKGYSDGGFHPKDPIERKDVMILLYRLAGRPSVTGTLDFPDCQSYKPGTDTYNAILWGSQNEITKGYSDGTFGPRLNCLREQIVTFLYRYDNLD